MHLSLYIGINYKRYAYIYTYTGYLFFFYKAHYYPHFLKIRTLSFILILCVYIIIISFFYHYLKKFYIYFLRMFLACCRLSHRFWQDRTGTGSLVVVCFYIGWIIINVHDVAYKVRNYEEHDDVIWKVGF